MSAALRRRTRADDLEVGGPQPFRLPKVVCGPAAWASKQGRAIADIGRNPNMNVLRSCSGFDFSQEYNRASTETHTCVILADSRRAEQGPSMVQSGRRQGRKMVIGVAAIVV